MTNNKYCIVFNNKDFKNPLAGGGTYLIHRLMKRLVKEGYEVYQFSSSFPNSPRKEVVGGVNISRSGSLATTFYKSIIQSKRLVKHKGYDPSFIIDSALFGIPYFTNIFYPNVFRLSVYFHMEQDVFVKEMKKRIGNLVGAIGGGVMKEIESYIVPMFSRGRGTVNITFSRPTYDEMLLFGFKKRNTLWFQEGIELEYYPKLEEPKEKGKYFLYVGRLQKYKGVYDLLYGFKLFSDRYPDYELKYIGQGELYQELVELTDKLGLQEKVTLYGYVSHEKKIELLENALAVVSPSYKEGWATPITEGNAVGAIGIASTGIGVIDSIHNGRTGYSFEVGNIKSLAKAMEEIVESPEKRKEKEKEALLVSKSFDWKKIENKILKVLDSRIK